MIVMVPARVAKRADRAQPRPGAGAGADPGGRTRGAGAPVRRYTAEVMVTRPTPETAVAGRADPWRIELLGGIRARRGRTLVNEFRTRRAAILLARLALNARAHRRDELIDMLWPGATPAGGRQNLSQSLSELRRRLESPHECEFVFATREMVWLDREHVRTDVDEFEMALADARAATGSERYRQLQRAVEIAHAPLLPGIEQEWAASSRERLSAECDAVLHELVGYYERTGDLSSAFEAAWRRVRIDPLAEEAHCEFAHLYERAGRPEAALHHLAEFELSLARRLGTAPGAATLTMLESLRSRLRAMEGAGA
jgi:DNA-binding SARP family transcriptional activator